ncbi:hypothetical protein BG011_007465 [Mortierella polycephala]|uniref:AP complex mu/sigma subunit domain-containing protein n=1 Tax=Mortierella polycephala TaxID=41804 RepID=A0A9P6TYK7_9FUNG|nr:hypothetical protein BG011_007465 [Mortierella polycephala]
MTMDAVPNLEGNAPARMFLASPARIPRSQAWTQGKTRLAKWFTTLSSKEKTKTIKDVTQMVLSRRTKMCNFLEYRGVGPEDNELLTLEIIHRYVEVLDRYFGNVCELDLIFNFQRAYFLLDELLIAGEMQESSKVTVLQAVHDQDAAEVEEANEEKNK